MGATKAEKQELKAIGYELFIGALSILSITNLVLQLVVQDPSLETCSPALWSAARLASTAAWIAARR